MAINIFKLEHGMYFVGKTEEAPICEWTTLHKPIKLYTSFSYDKKNPCFTEDEVVREFMRRFGKENVRGGSYSEVKLSEKQLKGLEWMLKTSSKRSCNYTYSYVGEDGTAYPYRRIWKYKGLYNQEHLCFECDGCGVGFDTRKELKNHLEEFNCGADFGCVDCYRGFHTQEEMDTHICKDYWDCDECNYRFFSKEEFDTHECSDDENYCRVCGSLFHEYSSLQAHMKIHEGWICHTCDNVFHTKQEYDEHCEEIKYRNEKCKHCDKHSGHDVMIGNDSWHMKNRYHCRVCGQGFIHALENEFHEHQESCSIKIVNT